MRVLYLTNGFPYPLTSGYLRHYFLIKELSQSHRITLLSVVGPSFVPEHAEALKSFTERVFTFSAPGRGRSVWHKGLATARSLVTRGSAELQIRAAIQQLVQQEYFDVVLFSGKPTYTAIDGLDTPPVVADFTDAASMRIRRQVPHSGRAKQPYLWLKYFQVRRLERKILKRATHAMFVSVRDRDAIVGRSGNHASVVPNGVDLDFWKRSSDRLGRNTLIFTGAMNYAPNADVAAFLIRTILPLVRRSIPDAQVLVVGHSPNSQLVKEGQQPGVTVTGYVDDVRLYLERATLFVAPLRFGAGVQNKLLEAMAMKVPVVASPLAAEGLRTEAGDKPPIQVAEAAQQFADIICQQLVERDRHPAPDAEARRFVETHFVWKRSGEKVDQVLRMVAGEEQQRME
jgi:glycosyltransferase involved in cell wall biosynthesis